MKAGSLRSLTTIPSLANGAHRSSFDSRVIRRWKLNVNLARSRNKWFGGFGEDNRGDDASDKRLAVFWDSLAASFTMVGLSTGPVRDPYHHVPARKRSQTLLGLPKKNISSMWPVSPQGGY